MKINYGKQVDINDIENYNIDLFLLAQNHEERAFTAFEYVSEKVDLKQIVALSYIELFKDVDKIKSIYIESHIKIIEVLDQFLLTSTSDTFNLVVDYSCMTKSWYYTIILYLNQKHLHQKDINVFFVYTPSKYSKPLAPKPNTEIAPLPGKYVVPTDKPKALIVCLGYEQNKAQGIIEHLDPKISYILYSKPAIDDAFVKSIEENNKELLEQSENVITFPLEDLIMIERELVSLYFLLKKDYSIIIAPLGPKPFAFMAMLLSIKYEEIDIWRVGSGSDINEYRRSPIASNKFIVSFVNFNEDL